MPVGAGIKLRHLQAFLEVARLRSLTEAASALNVTQPAVSKTLKELEALVGVSLMERGPFGGDADGGRRDLPPLCRPVGRRAGRRARRHRPGAHGLGAATAHRCPAERCGEHRGRWPPGAIWSAAVAPRSDIVTGPNGHLLDQLRTGALDVVIGRLGQPDAMQGLAFQQLYSEQVVLAVRPGHPLIRDPDLARLPEFPVLYPNRSAAIRPLVERPDGRKRYRPPAPPDRDGVERFRPGLHPLQRCGVGSSPTVSSPTILRKGNWWRSPSIRGSRWDRSASRPAPPRRIRPTCICSWLRCAKRSTSAALRGADPQPVSRLPGSRLPTGRAACRLPRRDRPPVPTCAARCARDRGR